MNKVFIIDSNNDYHNMFVNAGWEVVNDFFEADLIQFTGGSDVNPALYGEKEHPRTSCFPRRDLVEAGYYKHGLLTGKKMAGICRGGQFLHVMNGGKMWQHVDGHAIHGTHLLYDVQTNAQHYVTSTHHQMMRLSGNGGELVAWGQETSFREHVVNGELAHITNKGQADAEAIYYDKTKSLCFQPHPEFYGAHSTREYYFELLERYLALK
ncbi:putative glutamine amidotransferase [compost metagenome]